MAKRYQHGLDGLDGLGPTRQAQALRNHLTVSPRVRIDVASNFPADDPQRSDENKCKK